MNPACRQLSVCKGTDKMADEKQGFVWPTMHPFELLRCLLEHHRGLPTAAASLEKLTLLKRPWSAWQSGAALGHANGKLETMI